MFRTVSMTAVAGLSIAFAVPAHAQTPVGDLQAPDARAGEIAEVDGASIFYDAAGEGPPVMLLHGYPLSGALFARMRDELQGHAHRHHRRPPRLWPVRGRRAAWHDHAICRGRARRHG